MRNTLFWMASVIVFIVPNVMILQKERLLKEGSSVLLRLAPVDPRSLIQGDYMILDYQISRDAAKKRSKDMRNGHLVLFVDRHQVGHFRRFYKGKALAKGERLLRFRYRSFRVRLGAESFFFQEGHGKYYQKARYGELKVTPSGDSLLVGLRDRHRKKMTGPSSTMPH